MTRGGVNMSKQIQLRRGTTDEHADFVGADGEVTVDTLLKSLVVHDGKTPGGTVTVSVDVLFKLLSIISNSQGWSYDEDGCAILDFGIL